jgi:hypothetical protein
MLFQKNLNITILKYQFRNFSFLTPLLLIPTLYISSNFKLNIMVLSFVLIQSPFINPSTYYGFSEIFKLYFKFSIRKRIIIFAVNNFIWYNIFFIIGLLLFVDNKIKYLIQFELILLSSILIGSLINFYINKEESKQNLENILGYCIFSSLIFYINTLIIHSI